MMGLAIPAVAGSAVDQSVLDVIAEQCGLRAGDVTFNATSNLVRILPKGQTTTQPDQIACLLPALTKAGYRTKVGFISNPADPAKKK